MKPIIKTIFFILLFMSANNYFAQTLFEDSNGEKVLVQYNCGETINTMITANIADNSLNMSAEIRFDHNYLLGVEISGKAKNGLAKIFSEGNTMPGVGINLNFGYSFGAKKRFERISEIEQQSINKIVKVDINFEINTLKGIAETEIMNKVDDLNKKLDGIKEDLERNFNTAIDIMEDNSYKKEPIFNKASIEKAVEDRVGEEKKKLIVIIESLQKTIIDIKISGKKEKELGSQLKSLKEQKENIEIIESKEKLKKLEEEIKITEDDLNKTIKEIIKKKDELIKQYDEAGYLDVSSHYFTSLQNISLELDKIAPRDFRILNFNLFCDTYKYKFFSPVLPFDQQISAKNFVGTGFLLSYSQFFNCIRTLFSYGIGIKKDNNVDDLDSLEFTETTTQKDSTGTIQRVSTKKFEAYNGTFETYTSKSFFISSFCKPFFRFPIGILGYFKYTNNKFVCPMLLGMGWYLCKASNIFEPIVGIVGEYKDNIKSGAENLPISKRFKINLLVAFPVKLFN